MFTKFGFAILVLMFGIALFLAGLEAPPNVRAPALALAERCLQALNEPYSRLVQWWFGKGTAQPPQTSVAQYRDLLITSSMFQTSSYGLQVGLYGDQTQALNALEAIAKQGHLVQLITVGAESTDQLYVVALGPFASYADASAARATITASALPVYGLLPIAMPKGTISAAVPSASPPALGTSP